MILESERSARSRGYPVLACNVSVLAQVFEWTGDVSMCCEGGREGGREGVTEGGRDREGGRRER